MTPVVGRPSLQPVCWLHPAWLCPRRYRGEVVTWQRQQRPLWAACWLLASWQHQQKTDSSANRASGQTIITVSSKLTGKRRLGARASTRGARARDAAGTGCDLRRETGAQWLAYSHLSRHGCRTFGNHTTQTRLHPALDFCLELHA